MKLRLLLAVLLIAAGFAALHFAVGLDGIVKGSGSKGGPIQQQTDPGGSTGRIAVNEQGIGIGGRGKFQLSLNTVEIELDNGDVIPVPKIVVRGVADTPQGDTLEVENGTIEFYEPAPEQYESTGSWAEAVARAEFGRAIFVIGRNADGEISMLDATRDLDLRDATVTLLGKRELVLRDVRRLRVREDAGILSFDAPPIEDIPQPIEIELTDESGTPVLVQGLGIEGSFPTNEGGGDIEFEILEQPTIAHATTRVIGNGRARYDERGSDGAARFFMDGGLQLTSREFDERIELRAQLLDLHMIRLLDLEADQPILPRSLALIGDVRGTFGKRVVETDRIEVAFAPNGLPYQIRAGDSVLAEDPDQGLRARLRGAFGFHTPGALMAMVHRGYGIRGDGLPLSVGGFIRVGGTSESEFDGSRLTAGGRLIALAAATGDLFEGLASEGLVRADGPIVFEREGVVVRAERGVDLVANGDQRIATLGPRDFDPEHGFSITRRDAETDLVFSGRGSARLTQDANGAAKVRTETPGGRGRIRSDRFVVEHIDRAEADVTAEGRIENAQLIGTTPLDIRGTLPDGREARVRAGTFDLPNDSTFTALAPEEGTVELEFENSRVLGRTLTGKSFFGALDLRVEGEPAQIEVDLAEADTPVHIDLRASSVTTRSTLVPPFVADLHRAPFTMPNALRATFVFARDRVTAESRDANGTSTASGDLLVARVDQRTAWLFGSPAVARSEQTDGQTVAGSGPIVRVDLGDAKAPRLALLPEGEDRPSIVIEQESDDPALRRLRIAGSGPLALDGGVAQLEGPVRIRSVDADGHDLPDGLELFAPELAFEWSPAERTLRRLTASGGATFSLRDIEAEAQVLDLDGLTPTIDGETSWKLRLTGSRDDPAEFRSARTGEYRSTWIEFRYPDERLSTGPSVLVPKRVDRSKG